MEETTAAKIGGWLDLIGLDGPMACVGVPLYSCVLDTFSAATVRSVSANGALCYTARLIGLDECGFILTPAREGSPFLDITGVHKSIHKKCPQKCLQKVSTQNVQMK